MIHTSAEAFRPIEPTRAAVVPFLRHPRTEIDGSHPTLGPPALFVNVRLEVLR